MNQNYFLQRIIFRRKYDVTAGEIPARPFGAGGGRPLLDTTQKLDESLRNARQRRRHASLSGSSARMLSLADSAWWPCRVQTKMKVLMMTIKDMMMRLTWMRPFWRSRSRRWKRISLLYSGWPWMPIMCSPHRNISTFVFSDHPITFALAGSSLTFNVYS